MVQVYKFSVFEEFLVLSHITCLCYPYVYRALYMSMCLGCVCVCVSLMPRPRLHTRELEGPISDLRSPSELRHHYICMTWVIVFWTYWEHVSQPVIGCPSRPRAHELFVMDKRQTRLNHLVLQLFQHHYITSVTNWIQYYVLKSCIVLNGRFLKTLTSRGLPVQMEFLLGCLRKLYYSCSNKAL